MPSRVGGVRGVDRPVQLTRYNPLFVLVLPFVVAATVTRLHNRFLPEHPEWHLPSPSTPVRWALLGLVLTFFVARNVPLWAFQWMAP
jgi:hypothetical protein